MRVASFAGGLALLLSAVGLYGALAMSVTQRTREIGIRRALGAQTASVVALVLRQGMTPTLLGLGAGYSRL
jgi:ABC-type antimicrobial peptide transport system permease subunit